MANYNLVIDSKFEPFSYKDMLAPALMATTAHLQIEDIYSDLLTKASVWDEMADETNDPIAYNKYKLYSKELSAQAEILGSLGLNPNSRRSMLRMKQRYAKDIAPIEEAYNRRKVLLDEQRKALLLNPTLMFQRNLSLPGYESSLDRFIENPNYDYGQNYSGALLTLLVATLATALARELQDTGERGKKARAKLQQVLPYQYRILEKYGFDSGEVLKAIAQDPAASPILLNLVDSAIEGSGILDWGDAETLSKARAFANQGLWNAIGTSQYKYVTDAAGLQAHEYALRARAAKAAAEKEDKGGVSINTHTKFSKHGDVAKYQGIMGKVFVQDAKGNWLPSKAYFGKNGKKDPIKIYEEYWAAYNKNSIITNPSQRYLLPSMAGNTGYYQTMLLSRKDQKALNAANAVLRKYGVTKVLDHNQYKSMKSLNLPTNWDASMKYNNYWSDFGNSYAAAINSKEARINPYSTNMAKYDGISDQVASNLSSWTSTAGAIYKIDPETGAKLLTVKDPNSLGFNETEEKKKAKITDIEYTSLHPGYLLVTINKQGKSTKYLMDPEIFGGSYKLLLTDSQTAVSLGMDPGEAAAKTTISLVGMLNAYNTVKSETSEWQ